MTTQGMREGEMRRIAGLIAVAVRSDPQLAGGLGALHAAADEASALVARFPAYAPVGVPA